MPYMIKGGGGPFVMVTGPNEMLQSEVVGGLSKQL